MCVSSVSDQPCPSPVDIDILEQAQTLQPKLYRVAVSLVKCPHLAEDLVQDAFVKLLLMTAKFDEIASLEAFLIRMVRNLAIDRLRQLKREHELFAEDDGAHRYPNATGCSPETCVAGRQALGIVEEVIAGLPKRIREAFYRHRVEGTAQKCIAEEMGVSKALVCSYVSRGDAECRRALAAIETEETPSFSKMKGERS